MDASFWDIKEHLNEVFDESGPFTVHQKISTV